MGQVLLLERTVLEIAHDRIKLSHRVAYGSTGCKDHTTPAGQLRERLSSVFVNLFIFLVITHIKFVVNDQYPKKVSCKTSLRRY